MEKQGLLLGLSENQNNPSDVDCTIQDCGDLILHTLAQFGVKYIFGIPGGAIQPLYSALARNQAQLGISAIVARHESGASFMADGYTRESGIIGVCCATTGPGATNLITGVASAYENEIPQLIITAQTPLSTLGKGAFQESSCTGVNILGMFAQSTRYNSFVSHPMQLEHKLFAAIMAAYRRPCGPVHLSIPVDVFSAPSPVNCIHTGFKYPMKTHHLLDLKIMPLLLDEILKSKKIVFVVGMGCSGSVHAVIELSKLLGAKIVTSTDGKGLINPYHPFYRGVFGFAGHTSAKETLEDKSVDLVLAIGTNFSEWASGGWDEKALLNTRLIHIDRVDKHFEYSPMARMHVVGSIEGICEWLIKEICKNQSTDILVQQENNKNNATVISIEKERRLNCDLQEPEKYFSEETPIKPQRLMKELADRFPPSTRYLADTGNSTAWATHYLHPHDRRLHNRRSFNRKFFLDSGRRLSGNTLADASVYRACVDFASMGWAIGSALGTALANPKCPVVCITGDGSVLMNGQEITVALQHNLTVIYVILNDSSLGMVRHGQNLSKTESIGTQLPKVNFKQFAESMGIEAFIIRSPSDLSMLNIQAICQKSAPTVLDVYIDTEEVPPIGLRIDSLDKANKDFQ